MKNWEVKKLGDVCSFFNGQAHEKCIDENGKYKLINSKFVSSEGENFKRTNNALSPLFVNDIVMVMSDVPNGKTLAKCFVVDKEDTYTLNQRICVIRSKNFDTRFLYFQLNRNKYLLSFDNGENQSNLRKDDILNCELFVPPLNEQQRIVAILDDAFAKIEKAKANAEQNLKNAKELFDVYLYKYYASKEDGWEEKKMKDVAEYFNGLTYSPKDVSNEGIIVLRSSNVQNDELDFKDIVRVKVTVKEKIIVKEGDILMCSRNGSARLVGKTATIKNLEEEMTFGTFMMIIRSEYNQYLSWFFKSTDFRNQIKGGANTMINQITRYMLDDIVLSFPPIEKQNEVVRQLDALSIKIKKLETIYKQKINDLEELKKSVLQKAFNGELK